MKRQASIKLHRVMPTTSAQIPNPARDSARRLRNPQVGVMDSDERCRVTFTGTVSIAFINPGWRLEIAGPHQRCVVPRSVLTEPHAVAPSSLASTRSRGGGTRVTPLRGTRPGGVRRRRIRQPNRRAVRRRLRGVSATPSITVRDSRRDRADRVQHRPAARVSRPRQRAALGAGRYRPRLPARAGRWRDRRRLPAR